MEEICISVYCVVTIFFLLMCACIEAGERLVFSVFPKIKKRGQSCTHLTSRASRTVCSVSSFVLIATLAQNATPQTAAALCVMHQYERARRDTKMVLLPM